VTARRIPLVHRLLASVLAVSLTGFPVRVLAATELLDQGTAAQSVPVQPVPPPPAAPQAPVQQPAPQQPAYVQPAPQAPAPVQQPAPQQPAYVQPAPQAPAPVQQPAPQQPAYVQPAPQAPAPVQPPAYAQPPSQVQQPAPAQPTPQAPAPALPPAYAQPPPQQPAAAQPAPPQPPATQAPVYAQPPQVPAAPGAPGSSGTTQGIVPPGAVPVPQSAVPQTPRSQSDVEKEVGTAPPPAPPQPKGPPPRSLADDRLIRLEWRPEHAEGNYGYGPLVQVPVMGNDRRPLAGRSLYAALGRQDLAKEYERRAAAKRLMGVGAGLLLISGAVVALTAFGIHGCNPGDVHCYNDRDQQLRERFYWSGGLAAGGVVLGIASSSYSAHPVSRNELMSLIREHNRQVRAEAGVRVSPMVMPGGGGVSVGGSF
jgi:hypothetical protein